MTTATTFPRGLIVCLLAVCTFAGTIPARAQKAKSLFYMTREPKSVRSFLAQAEKIDIVVPYWYTVDSNGLVTGGPNPLVLETARQHHVPVMPLVTNAGFAQDDFHKLLKNPDAMRQFYFQFPGPVTGWNWTTANLDYALKIVPAQKLSLGIPLYG